jgi:hypothetical protein
MCVCPRRERFVGDSKLCLAMNHSHVRVPLRQGQREEERAGEKNSDKQAYFFLMYRFYSTCRPLASSFANSHFLLVNIETMLSKTSIEMLGNQGKRGRGSLIPPCELRVTRDRLRTLHKVRTVRGLINTTAIRDQRTSCHDHEIVRTLAEKAIKVGNIDQNLPRAFVREGTHLPFVL